MNDKKLEADLNKAVAESMDAEQRIPKVPLSQPLRPAPMPEHRQATPPSILKPEGSLSDQWNTMESIRWQLRQRIMAGRVDLENEFRRRRNEIEENHKKALLQMQFDLEARRDNQLKALAEEIRDKLREFEALGQRMDG